MIPPDFGLTIGNLGLVGHAVGHNGIRNPTRFGAISHRRLIPVAVAADNDSSLTFVAGVKGANIRAALRRRFGCTRG
jgi:hypothetical protein